MFLLVVKLDSLFYVLESNSVICSSFFKEPLVFLVSSYLIGSSWSYCGQSAGNFQAALLSDG